MNRLFRIFLIFVISILLVACGTEKDKNIVTVNDDPEVGEEITMVLKAYNGTYNGGSYSLVVGEDNKDYRVNFTWKDPKTELEINNIYEITGKFSGKELTGFDESGMIYSEFNMYDAVISE